MGKDFNLLAQLVAFARANDVTLIDPNITERLAADIAPRLQGAIKDRSLVYGMRTERLLVRTPCRTMRQPGPPCDHQGIRHWTKEYGGSESG